MTVQVKTRAGNPLATIKDRVRAFAAAEQKARLDAAALATQVTRQSFRYVRPVAPPRSGRSSTGGNFKSHLRWGANKRATGGVAFDVVGVDKAAPHWIIQEIGTGKSAKIADPLRSASGAVSNVRITRSVPSQRGRRIRGLVFATGPTGSYTPPGAARGQQLYLRSQVKGVPANNHTIRIRREIKGQHMVRRGGQAGFRQYQQQVMTAARRNFVNRRFTP